MRRQQFEPGGSYRLIAHVTWLGIAILLTGCGSELVAPLTIVPQFPSVRLGSTLALNAEQMGEPVSGAVWSVSGGSASGSIDENGVYTPPQTIPAASVTIMCQSLGQTATTMIALLNPTPAISQVSPMMLVELSTPVTVAGNGFVAESQILVGGVAVPTTFVDSSHLSFAALVPNNTTTSLALAVSNPAPGALVSSAFTVPVAIAPLTVSPQSPSVRLGSTLALSGMQLGAPVSGGVWSVTGGDSNGSITSGGIYTPPASIPPSSVTITYQALGQTATSTLTVVNPAPVIRQITPAQLTQLSTPIVLAGSGFVAGSQILMNGTPVPTIVADNGHLSATLLVSSISVTSLALAVSNPNPGAIVSSPTLMDVAIAPLTISPASPSVRLGSTLALSAHQLGAPVSGAEWNVNGGSVNGSVDANGVYSPPPTIPAAGVTVMCQALGQTATTTIALLNPTPIITQVSPATLIQLSTPVTVIGSGFVPGSQIFVDGSSVQTVFVDSNHLSGTIVASNTSVTSLAVSVGNPSPGPMVSIPLVMPVAIALLTISPQGASVRLGATLALSGFQQGASLPGGVWSVAGGAANGSISSSGLYTPPLSLPPSNVTVTYQAVGQAATATVMILNPIPAISQIAPAQLGQLSTSVTVTGSGFVSGSRILADGTAIPTTMIDSNHLSGTVAVPSISVSSLALTVSNPNPGAVVSSPTMLAVSIPPLTISPQSAPVRLGSTLALSGIQLGTPVSGGVWSVTGGAGNGSITAEGIYTPPASIPPSSVTVTYQALGQTASSTIAVLNPIPVIGQLAPAQLTQLSTHVVLAGSGFVVGSQILVNGTSVPTIVVDGGHLSATLLVPSISVTSIELTVSNPNPGAIASGPATVLVAIAPLTVFPASASVRLGSTLALNVQQQGTPVSGAVWSVNGGPSNGYVDANGVYSPPPRIPTASVTITCQALGQTATATIALLNPAPVITRISPATLVQLSTPVIVTGSGFIAGSQILIGGTAIATSFVDSHTLSGAIGVSNVSVTSLSVSVANPSPGPIVSNLLVLPVAIAPLIISPFSGSVRLGSTLTLSAEQQGAPVSGAIWSVNGGSSFGSIDATGVYSPPLTIPVPGVTVTCQALGQTATVTIALLNPTPVINQVTPTTLVQLSTPVTLIGTGFISGSQILVGGVAFPTTFVDSNHLSLNALVLSNTITSIALAVSNPAPGALVSKTFTAPVSIAPLSVLPVALSGGNFTITASIPGLPGGSVVTVNGTALITASADTRSITATGYLPYWQTGSATVAVVPSGGGSPFAQLDVPITATAVSYDVAARFAMQAGFGPRHDIIEHIQQTGLSNFIDEQLQVAPDTYTSSESPPRNFLLNVVHNNTQLRLRTAWAFQSFIPEQGIFKQNSTLPWEETLEADAFGNFRQILLDAASDPNVTTLLNLPGSSVSSDPNVHPNQNFARELLQLFSIGTVMLNDDGTIQTDASGNPIPAYDQDTILGISRALTGWNYAPTVNPNFSFYGIDYTQKLVSTESRHDTGSKTIFGSIVLAAGQTATQDRDQVLDAVFQHQNVPAFVSRRLIQRFVKGQPSPAYIARISAVFKDDGDGVRGNLAAVIKALLLDPEARAGDTSPSEDDGFVQDPLFAQLFAMELMDIDSTDDSSQYYPGQLGEPYWFSPTVFAYYDPDYIIPGTDIDSPESQLLNTELIVQRSQFLWGMINGPLPSFSPWGSTWLSTRFPTVPALVDALNHIAYHGTMSDFERQTITNYCSSLPDPPTQLRCSLLLALNGDLYTVVH